MFIDTHAHLQIMVNSQSRKLLDESDFPKIQEILAESANAGVQTILNIGTDYIESLNSVILAKRFAQIFAVVGIHPTDIQNWKEEFVEIKKLVKDKEANKIVGIGETGLDFYHKPYDKEKQIASFTAHIELSIEHNLPLSIHVRDAADETLRVLENYKNKIRGVNHCFVHSLDFAKTIMSWGLYIGIDAPITYPKNGELRNTLSQLPLEKMVLETDSPFLPPQQFRGKQNHPKYIPLFAKTLADLKGISLFDLAAITTTNAQSLFSLI